MSNSPRWPCFPCPPAPPPCARVPAPDESPRPELAKLLPSDDSLSANSGSENPSESTGGVAGMSSTSSSPNMDADAAALMRTPLSVRRNPPSSPSSSSLSPSNGA